MLARVLPSKHCVRVRVSFAIVAASTALAGCAPSHVWVRPQSTDVVVSHEDTHLEAFVRVPEVGAGGLDVRVWSNGAYKHSKTKNAPKRVSLAVDVEVENRSESVVAKFDPQAARLFAADYGELSPVVTGSASAAATTVSLLPGARRTFHLVFIAPGTKDPRELVPFSLRLVFDYGDTALPVVVRFVREYPSSYYYGSPVYAPYYGYAPGYWGGPGFYGGWGWGPAHWW
jgi:hypothetical protein